MTCKNDSLPGTIEELPEGWEDKGECIGGFLSEEGTLLSELHDNSLQGAGEPK